MVAKLCQFNKEEAVNKLGKFNAAYLNSKQEIKLNAGNFKFGHSLDKQWWVNMYNICKYVQHFKTFFF